MYIFEFDPDKSESNRKKHGIDFEAAQRLWDDPNLLEVQAKSDDESRYLVIGLIARKHWSAIVTYREDKVRIISVRRSRQIEVEIYEI
ncbi:MAG: toxin [SAR86 cluster bacterium]|uniref:Toxin n=1 Tax=SAR86 cluster bacterium TaxID=2030880 RepID=A0A2A5AQ78_9GAMM|nr:MAG: toxin [SAR86 cluster bacterium]